MKQTLKGADEFDCASRRARKFLNPPKQSWGKVKRKMNKRFRKEGKSYVLDD